MKAPLYNWKGEVISEIEIPESVFGAPWNPSLVHQALQAQIANRRKPLAHTKNRGEVSGGGKKPWRQKGTGRARHGSIRSPLWKGGGVTHGPRREKIYAVKLNKKMRSGALRSLISKKLKSGELKFLDAMEVSSAKTKELNLLLHQFLVKSKQERRLSALLVPPKGGAPIFRASSNLPTVKSLGAGSLNVEDVLKYRNVIVDRRAISELKVAI